MNAISLVKNDFIELAKTSGNVKLPGIKQNGITFSNAKDAGQLTPKDGEQTSFLSMLWSKVNNDNNSLITSA
jgi:hypothetical protein